MRIEDFTARVIAVVVALLGVVGPDVCAAMERSARGEWVRLDRVPVRKERLRPWVRPEHFVPYRLDAQALRRTLLKVPGPPVAVRKSPAFVIELPTPQGGFARYRITETALMHPDLARKFPEIKTYAGRGIDDPQASIRMDFTPQGFHAQVLSPRGACYIDPYSHGDTTTYACYYKRNYRALGKQFQCLVDEGQDVAGRAPVAARTDNGDTLRTFRLACAATGEYTAFHGGTVAAGLAAIVTTVNRVVGIYELEVAVSMQLVANNNLIVYTGSGTDPYTNNNGIAMLGENQSNLDSVIGSANYDIGHVFSTGGGGIAGLGVVCNNSRKAEGVTGLPSPVGDSFDVDFVAHEMGHQFNGSHTFNGSQGNCSGENRTGSTAYEPGSGSTIMAYAGICGTDNLQAHSDPYFHFASLDQITSFVSSGGGSGCASNSVTGNTVPTAGAGADYTIPRSTPFELTASGSDPNGDTLTYAWEERDLGAAQQVGDADNGASPIFRTWDPTSDPVRTFPRLQDLLNNTLSTGEKLPTTSRSLNFRITVRDNRSGGGGFDMDDMLVTVDATTGPFTVTAPNTAVNWSGARTVTWSVGGTAGGAVNATNVDIMLSTNGGMSFDIALASAVPNDGSHGVVLPAISNTQARIKVQGSGNIFFDVSDANFTVEFSDDLAVTPFGGFSSTGEEGGPFAPACRVYSLSNTGGSSLTWTSVYAATWLDVSPRSGVLTGGGTTNIDVCVANSATGLTAATYSDTLTFSNASSGVAQDRGISLQVDPFVPGAFEFTTTGYSVLESTASATVSVARVGGASGAVSVRFSTSNGTASAGTDYTTSTGTLSWAASDSSNQVFTVPITDDSDIEGSETISLFLSEPTGNASLAAPSNATLTILDDDATVIVADGATLLVEGCFPTNGLIDPGETVTVDFSVRSTSGPNTSNLVATLETHGGVTFPGTPQSYGVLTAGGAAVARGFAFTPTGTCGGTVTARLALQDGALDLGTVDFLLDMPGRGATTQEFNYAGSPVSIPDANANGVDILITVSNLFGLISDLDFNIGGSSCSSSPNATGNGINHTWVGDLTITLESPEGTVVTLMQKPGPDAAGSSGNHFCNTVLDDDNGVNSIQSIAKSGAPPLGPPYTGVFTPLQALSAFDGENPNGTWTVNISDDAAGETGDARDLSVIITADGGECCVSSNAADIAIGKTASQLTPLEGASVDYTIVVTNLGPNLASGVVATDAVPAGVTYISSSSTNYSQASGEWVIGSLAVGASTSLVISVSVDGGTAGNTITNTATVSSANPPDPVTANNTATATFTVPLVDINVTKSVDNATPGEDDAIVYTIAVSNRGPSAASGVIITDSVPVGVTYVSDNSADYAPSNGLWNVGALASGSGTSLTITVTVNAATLGQSITNQASVLAVDQSDQTPGNDSDIATILVSGIDVGITKLVDDATPGAGDTINYTLIVTNLGPGNASGVVVTDAVPAGVTFQGASSPGYNPGLQPGVRPLERGRR